MTGFSAAWLALREPFDAAARATAWPTLGPLVDAIRRQPTSHATAPLRVLDLACGSGANLRTLAPRLGGTQVWQLVDHDPALLAALPQAMARWANDHGYRLDIGHDTSAGLRVEGSGFSAELVTNCADLGNGLAGMDIGQLNGLSTEQFAALTTGQIASLSDIQIQGLASADIAALTTAQAQALTTEQIVALTTDQVAALEHFPTLEFDLPAAVRILRYLLYLALKPDMPGNPIGFGIV